MTLPFFLTAIPSLSLSRDYQKQLPSVSASCGKNAAKNKKKREKEKQKKRDRYINERDARLEAGAREWEERQAALADGRRVIEVAETEAVAEAPPPPAAAEFSRAELGAIPKSRPASHEAAGPTFPDLPAPPQPRPSGRLVAIYNLPEKEGGERGILIQLSIPGERKGAGGGYQVAIHDSSWPRGHVVLNNSPLRHEIPEGWLPEDYQQLLSEQVRSDALNRNLPAGLEDISDGEFPTWMTLAQGEKLPPWITRAEEAEKDVVDLHGDEF